MEVSRTLDNERMVILDAFVTGSLIAMVQRKKNDSWKMNETAEEIFNYRVNVYLAIGRMETLQWKVP